MFSYLWGGSTTKPVQENENPELAMRADLDKHKNFKTNIDGTMEFEDFLVLRSIIMRQANRQYAPQKKQFKEQQYKIYLSKNQQEYVMNFQQAQKAYTECVIFMTRKACEWLEFDFKNYQLTHNAVIQNQEQAQKIAQRDNDVRETLLVETTTVSITKEKAVEAIKFKIKEELGIYRKLQALMFTTNDMQRNVTQAIEFSKLSDKVQEQFGFDADELAAANKKYNLAEDKEIIGFSKLAAAQRQSEAKQEFDRATPKPEVIAELVKRGQLLGEVQYKQDGTMTFDFFLSTMKIASEYTINHTFAGLLEFQVQRRAALKAGNQEEYQAQILKAANWEQLSSRLIEANLYQALKVPKPVFEKSMQTYMMDPSKRTIFEEEMGNLRESLRKRTISELTREQIISSVEKLEIAKLEAQKKMYMIVRAQKLQPAMINALIKVEKLKADDQFFNDTGIEEEDVEPNIKRLGLDKDPEYLALIENYAKQSASFLEERKAETQLFMEKVKAMQAEQDAKKAEADAIQAQTPESLAFATGGIDAALI